MLPRRHWFFVVFLKMKQKVHRVVDRDAEVYSKRGVKVNWNV